MSSRLSSSEFELSRSLAASHVVSPRNSGGAMRCVALASCGAGRGWCRIDLQPPPIRSRPSTTRPGNPIPHALDSAGRPVRTPHLRERRWLLRASRPRADTGVFTRATTTRHAPYRIAFIPFSSSKGPFLCSTPAEPFLRPDRFSCPAPRADRVKAGRRPPRRGLALTRASTAPGSIGRAERVSHAAARVLAVLRVASSGTSPSSR